VLAGFIGDRLAGPAINRFVDLGQEVRRAWAMAPTERPLMRWRVVSSSLMLAVYRLEGVDPPVD
jgi:hypothetical protein